MNNSTINQSTKIIKITSFSQIIDSFVVIIIDLYILQMIPVKEESQNV